MFSLCPVFIQDTTEGHSYKVILKHVHFFLSKKGDTVGCLYFIFILYSFGLFGVSLVAQTVKNLSAMWKTRGKIPLEKGMSTSSGILAWGIQWTEGPGEPQPTGSQRVGHDRVTEAELRKIKLCSDHFSMLLNNHSEQHFCPVLDHPVILCYVGPLYKPPRVVQGASSPLNV